MSSDEGQDLEIIGAAIDGDGDTTTGRKPIENPADASREAGEDPLLEPRSDEPGVKSDGESGPAENPGDRPPSAPPRD